jgi:hypothetical protein
MSNTPNTDAIVSGFRGHVEMTQQEYLADFARKLERENAQLRTSLKELIDGMCVAIDCEHWKVDGSCDPDAALTRARAALKGAA